MITVATFIFKFRVLITKNNYGCISTVRAGNQKIHFFNVLYLSTTWLLGCICLQWEKFCCCIAKILKIWICLSHTTNDTDSIAHRFHKAIKPIKPTTFTTELNLWHYHQLHYHSSFLGEVGLPSPFQFLHLSVHKDNLWW